MEIFDPELTQSGKQVLSDVDFLAAHCDCRDGERVGWHKQGGQLLIIACGSSGND